MTRETPKSLPTAALLIVGNKNSGKTTLIEKLIPELSARGYRVGTVKHHHSSIPLDVDREGKDSWRHRKAGATAVALISPTEVAIFQNTDEGTPLDQVIAALRDVDVVLVEGFKSIARPRIQIGNLRPEYAGDGRPEHLLAVLNPPKIDGHPPYFDPAEIRHLVDLIEERLLLGPPSSCAVNLAQPSPSLNKGEAKT